LGVTVAQLDFDFDFAQTKPEVQMSAAPGFPYWITDFPCDLAITRMTTRARVCGAACSKRPTRRQVRANPALS